MRLLLIEDDDILGEGLRDYLRADGHVVDWCRDLKAVAALHGEPFDAWLVDWQLPDGSGLQWLQRARQRGDTTPALMLTARDQPAAPHRGPGQRRRRLPGQTLRARGAGRPACAP